MQVPFGFCRMTRDQSGKQMSARVKGWLDPNARFAMSVILFDPKSAALSAATMSAVGRAARSSPLARPNSAARLHAARLHSAAPCSSDHRAVVTVSYSCSKFAREGM
jgi:hypothetical protein